MQQRYWRASRAFDVKIAAVKNPVDKAKLKVTLKRNKQWDDWAQLSEGCYLLRTNLTNVDQLMPIRSRGLRGLIG